MAGEDGQRESRASTLEKEGWTRQFVATEPRLSEAMEMYEEAGFDVHLEPMPATELPGEPLPQDRECRRCFQGVEHQYKILYTRPRKGRPNLEEDLF